MGIINPLKRYTESLEKGVQKAFEEAGIKGFRFIKIAPQPEKVEDKVKSILTKGKTEVEEELAPFILIRPLASNQKYKNGECTKTTDYLIRIQIKNEDIEDGFFEVTYIGEYLVSYFTKHPSALQNRDGFDYSINLDNIDSYLQEELISKDHWTYDIILQLNIPFIPHGDYYDNNLKII